RLVATTGTIPARDRVGRPPGWAVRVACGARIRRSDLRGEIGPRDADGVIAARVDHHVALRRHGAVDAERTRRAGGVEVVCRRVVVPGDEPGEALPVGRALMAADAERVAVGKECGAMRVVAVGAADTGLVHPALAEGAILVHLAELLTIGII